MKSNAGKSKMTPEEVRKRLDQFYDEVEAQEKSDGLCRHVDGCSHPGFSLKEKICAFFRTKRK